MIPYEELCDALARWRSANGMTNGPSASPPPRSSGVVQSQAPSTSRTSQPYAAQSPSPSPSQGRTSQPYAAQSPAPPYGSQAAYEPPPLAPPYGAPSPYTPPSFIPSVTQPEAPNLFGGDSGDRTELHSAVPPGAGNDSFDVPHHREDATGEIDIDSVDVVEEEEIP